MTETIRAPHGRDGLAADFGFSARGEGAPEVVLAEETAVELGHPSTASRAITLLAHDKALVEAGRISVVGPDLDRIGPSERRPYAQVVLLALREGCAPDPFEIDNAQYLMHRLPGYMVRSVPGRLWARVSRRGLAAGLTFGVLGSALITAFTEDFDGVQAAEAVFVTASRRDVDALAPIAAEAQILAGRHKKLVLGLDGEVECTDLDCESCEEKPVCDDLRDIVIKRRNTR